MERSGRIMLTVDKALLVMQALARRPGGWGVTELARHLGQGSSVVHAILQTLLARGFAEQEPLTKRYRLGPAVLSLAQALGSQADLRTVARGPMQALANATGECAYCYVPAGNASIAIHRAEPPEVLRVTTEVGAYSPLHAGSNPKAILAFLPPEQIERYLSVPLEKPTVNSPTDPAVVARQLEEVRRSGYSYTEEELFEGIAGLAAPFFDAAGRVCGSVGVGGLISRVRANREEIARRTLEAARAISASLGFRQTREGEGWQSLIR